MQETQPPGPGLCSPHGRGVTMVSPTRNCRSGALWAGVSREARCHHTTRVAAGRRGSRTFCLHGAGSAGQGKARERVQIHFFQGRPCECGAEGWWVSGWYGSSHPSTARLPHTPSMRAPLPHYSGRAAVCLTKSSFLSDAWGCLPSHQTEETHTAPRVTAFIVGGITTLLSQSQLRQED